MKPQELTVVCDDEGKFDVTVEVLGGPGITSILISTYTQSIAEEYISVPVPLDQHCTISYSMTSFSSPSAACTVYYTVDSRSAHFDIVSSNGNGEFIIDKNTNITISTTDILLLTVNVSGGIDVYSESDNSTLYAVSENITIENVLT